MRSFGPLGRGNESSNQEHSLKQGRKFYFEAFEDPKSVKGFLQPLIEGIEMGKVNLGSEGRDMTMNPGNLLKLKVKAKKRGRGGKISLNITWVDTEDDGELLVTT